MAISEAQTRIRTAGAVTKKRNGNRSRDSAGNADVNKPGNSGGYILFRGHVTTDPIASQPDGYFLIVGQVARNKHPAC